MTSSSGRSNLTILPRPDRRVRTDGSHRPLRQMLAARHRRCANEAQRVVAKAMASRKPPRRPKAIVELATGGRVVSTSVDGFRSSVGLPRREDPTGRVCPRARRPRARRPPAAASRGGGVSMWVARRVKTWWHGGSCCCWTALGDGLAVAASRPERFNRWVGSSCGRHSVRPSVRARCPAGRSFGSGIRRGRGPSRRL